MNPDSVVVITSRFVGDDGVAVMALGLLRFGVLKLNLKFGRKNLIKNPRNIQNLGIGPNSFS